MPLPESIHYTERRMGRAVERLTRDVLIAMVLLFGSAKQAEANIPPEDTVDRMMQVIRDAQDRQRVQQMGWQPLPPNFQIPQRGPPQLPNWAQPARVPNFMRPPRWFQRGLRRIQIFRGPPGEDEVPLPPDVDE